MSFYIFKTIECPLCMTNTLVLCYNGLVMVSGRIHWRDWQITYKTSENTI